MASFVYTQQTLAETGFTPFPELVITQQALAEPGYQDSTPHVDLYQTMVEIGWRSPSIKVYAVVMDRPDGSKSILGVPEPGDRSAWDVGDFDELHASDIDADELVRHTPLPGTPGDMIVEGVSGFWTRVTMYGDATLDPDGRLNLTGAVSGESSFIDLTDTPATYVGSGGKIVRVVDAATALQFGADLDNLDDVNAPAPAEGQVLTYRASFGEWRAENPAGGGGGPTSFFVEDEGSLLSGHVDRLDFRGAGVTATRINKKEVRVTIPGGGGGGASSFFVAPDKDAIFSDEQNVITGNAFTKIVDSAHPYCFYTYQNPPAINDDKDIEFYLSAGDYTLRELGTTNNNRGIVTYYIDGVSQGTIDWYSGGLVRAVEKDLAVTVVGNGPHVLRMLMASKNGSSSNYFHVWTKITFFEKT